MEGNEDLIRLIQNFEEKSQTGTILYLDEVETQQLITYYEESSMIDKAINVVDMALEINKFREENYILKARLLRKEGRYYEALDTLETSSLFTPNSIENIILTIRIYLDLKSIDRALSTLNEYWEGIKLHSYTTALLLKARVYEIQRNYDEMYKIVKKAVLHNYNSPLALDRFWVAVELTNNYKDSINIHSNIIDLNPYNYQAWYNLGHAYACVGEYLDAIAALEYSYIIEPDFEVGYFDCADICFQVEKFEKALSIYLEALRRFTPDCELLTRIGECYIKIGDHNTAKRYLKRAVSLDPYNDEVYFFLGHCYLVNRNYEEALKAFHHATDLEDRREEYYAALADTYVALKDFHKADYYYRKATETGPEDSLYWEKHVEFLYNLGVYTEVNEVFNESVMNTYSDLLTCYHFAALIKQNKNDDAYEALIESYSDKTVFKQLLKKIEFTLCSNKTVRDMLNLLDKE